VAPGTYDEIWEHQGKCCAICGRKLLRTRKRGALEHDHRINWPFGITCQPCNDFLGYIGRNPMVALALFRYLIDPPAWHVIGPPPEMTEPPF
jgi:recombination endonuclease VII